MDGGGLKCSVIVKCSRPPGICINVRCTLSNIWNMFVAHPQLHGHAIVLTHIFEVE